MKYQIHNGGEIVEAIQWNGTQWPQYNEVQAFDLKGYRNDGGFGPDWFLTSSKFFAHPSDWIVKFENGLVVALSDKTFTASATKL